MPDQTKSGWEKADIILKPLVGLLTAIIIGALGFYGSRFLENRQLIESKTRLYAELMSKREEADSSLRKEMFNSIINTFLTQDTAGPEKKVLALELLTYNFHEALDLGPLFKHVQREIYYDKNSDDNNTREIYLNRMKSVAIEVTGKQIAILEESGGKLDGTVDFDELNDRPEGIKVIHGTLPAYQQAKDDSNKPLRKRDFKVEVLYANLKRKEIRVKLEVRSPKGNEGAVDILYSVFWVGFFDFPMIDNTRLSDGDRCAVVLRKFQPSSAEITLVYFPGSRASLKEKPYYDEVIDELLRLKTQR